jgi:hypothetical protein
MKGMKKKCMHAQFNANAALNIIFIKLYKIINIYSIGGLTKMSKFLHNLIKLLYKVRATRMAEHLKIIRNMYKKGQIFCGISVPVISFKDTGLKIIFNL